MFGRARRHRFSCLRLFVLIGACLFGAAAAAQAKAAAQLLVPSDGESISLLVADILSHGASNEPQRVQVKVRSEPALSAESALRHLNAAPADGRTLLVLSSRVYEQVPAAQHTKVVVRLAAVPYLLVSTPAKAYSWAELARFGKQRTNAIAVSVSSHDDIARDGVMRLGQLTGMDLKPVSVDRNAHPTLSAALRHAADAAFEEAHVALPYVRGKRLTAVVTTSERRLPVIPGVAAASEIAPGYELTKWIGVFAHANTPPSEVLRMNTELERLLRSLPVRITLINLGLVTTSIDKEQFEQQVKQTRTLTANTLPPHGGQNLD